MNANVDEVNCSHPPPPPPQTLSNQPTTPRGTYISQNPSATTSKVWWKRSDRMVDVIHGFYFLYKHRCRESHLNVTFLLDCDFLTMVHILDPVKKTPLDIFKHAFFLFRSIQAISHKQRHPENTTTRRRCVRVHIQSAKIDHWFHHGWISSDGFSKGWTSSKTPRTCGTSATNNAGPAKEASHPGKGCSGCKMIYIQPHFQRRLSNKKHGLQTSSNTNSHNEHHSS